MITRLTRTRYTDGQRRYEHLLVEIRYRAVIGRCTLKIGDLPANQRIAPVLCSSKRNCCSCEHAMTYV